MPPPGAAALCALVPSPASSHNPSPTFGKTGAVHAVLQRAGTHIRSKALPAVGWMCRSTRIRCPACRIGRPESTMYGCRRRNLVPRAGRCVRGKRRIPMRWWRSGGRPTRCQVSLMIQSVCERCATTTLVRSSWLRPTRRSWAGVIVGFDGWRANLYRLAVHPQFRRQGMARALVAEAEHRLAARGARRATALVVSDHAGAVGLWEAVGYARDGRIARYVKTLGREAAD
jgi:GNAT superfamily N-acetyltransferase